MYRGVAHSACNLNYRISPKIWKLPVIIHNLNGYDGHLIVTSLKSKFGEVRVIPQNLEKYLPISVGRLKFLDSFQFTPQSLDVLSKTLEGDEFKYLAEACIGDRFELIRRKGVYPYDYMDSFDRFVESELPSQADFLNKLSGDACSDVDYAHAVRVWDVFNCETLGDYHDVYLQLDVLLLTDFFEKFRKTCLNYYRLDPVHYYTTPGLAWDASLRMSKVKLELIVEKDIYNLIDTSIRGGVSMISTRHAKANNPSLPSYDPELPRRDLIYLDANNLYGHAMSQYLPTGGFRILSDEEADELELENLSDDADDGYMYEVDLHYPTKLHDSHDDYPLAPQSLEIDNTVYSPTQSSVYPKSSPQK